MERKEYEKGRSAILRKIKVAFDEVPRNRKRMKELDGELRRLTGVFKNRKPEIKGKDNTQSRQLKAKSGIHKMNEDKARIQNQEKEKEEKSDKTPITEKIAEKLNLKKKEPED